MNNLNPLETIEHWLLTMPSKYQEDFILLSKYLHSNIKISSDRDITSFWNYLKEDVDRRETVSRAIQLIGLIEFALSNRDSEDDWQKSFDLHLYMKNREAEDGIGISEIHEKFFSNFENLKRDWIRLSNEWYSLRENELSYGNIASWMVSQASNK